jgi:hypothetical protein
MLHRSCDVAVYAVDIGSTRASRGSADGQFAWARLLPDGSVQGGRSIEKLVTRVAHELCNGVAVALGFEAPLAIPVPIKWKDLSRGREGESNRSFAAPVGLAVTALGLHQSAWILRELRQRTQNAPHAIRFSQLAADWPATTPMLFCWEAFVSRDAHSKDHMEDAATAVVAFRAVEGDLTTMTEVRAKEPISLIGAAALWADWVSDISELRTQPIVIMAKRKSDVALDRNGDEFSSLAPLGM